MPKSMGRIRISAPIPGTCPVCATKHGRQEPHDPNSLYYQNRFYKTHRRFPQWADALAHCDQTTKASWAGKLKKAGVEVVFPSAQEDEA